MKSRDSYEQTYYPVRSSRSPCVPLCLLIGAHAEHDHHNAADDRGHPGHDDHDADSLELEFRLWKMTKVGRRPFLISPTIIDHIFSC
jgi:hypothetical protein